MEIERDILAQLEEWKNNPHRKPLVLQGARQVGKSWILKKFGKECYNEVIYINFDTMPAWKEDFSKNKDPKVLVDAMSMTFGKSIRPEDTLIIWDEIQECNDALNSLKYFCEEAPEYSIVCAGSLLGVALNRTGSSFPVGKVDFMTLRPVSFSEFLKAAEPQLFASYRLIEIPQSVPQVLHEKLLEAYKVYLALGGMPEAVSNYIDSHDWQTTNNIQDGILQSYTYDFSKHISNKDIPRVYQVWDNLQDQLAREDKKFKYSDIRQGARAREYEGAIEWLRMAGLVQRVSCVETPRLPLSAYKKSGAFKLYLCDVGLLCRKFGLDAAIAIRGDRLFTEFKGVLAENYVLQSLVRQFGDKQYYWTSGNTAEVEFILQYAGNITPIEVKAEQNVKAKSLAIYRKTYEPKTAVRFSSLNMRRDNDLLNIPLYLVDRLKEVLSE